MKKIIYILPRLGGGGAEIAVMRICNAISEKKYKIYIFTAKGSNIYNKRFNKNVTIVSGFGLKNIFQKLLSNFKLLWLLIKIKPNVIVLKMIYTSFVFFPIIPFFRFFSKKVFLSLQNSLVLDDISLTKFSNRLITQFVLININKVICLSKGVYDELIGYKFKGNFTIEIISNPGYEINRENISDNKCKRNLELLACGRLNEQKNYKFMLKASKSFLKSTNSKLKILGEGPLKAEIQNLIIELGLEKHVFLLGYQKDPFKFYKESNIFLLSSSWEGFANVIIEAMSCGCVVLSTNCNHGPSELISHRINGCLVNLGSFQDWENELFYLANNPNERIKIQLSGYKKASNYRPKILCKRWDSLFL